MLYIMFKLEEFLDSIDNKTIDKEILYNYELFDYEDELIFNNHLKFLLENCYNIRINENKKLRLNQKEFRQKLLEKFNYKCIISENNCIHELKAAHIIPVSIDESYDIDNGLLLTSTLHDTMDKFLWSINPHTLKIEIKENNNVGQIKNYVGKTINLQMNDDLYNNLLIHYHKFNNKKN